MNRQRGIALVTAILVMALAVIAATAIMTSSNIAVHRAANLQDSERAWWYADGVEGWVKSVLERDLEDNQIDSLKDIWAKPVDYLPVDQPQQFRAQALGDRQAPGPLHRGLHAAGAARRPGHGQLPHQGPRPRHPGLGR
jgi:type II secretory pathway component PulK